MPTNGTIAFRFDRFLNPGTVNRQAIRVYTGDPDFSPALFFNVVYDPIERVAEFRLASGNRYRPRTLYHYELVAPELPGAFGIRAFDGAPIGEDGLPLRASFRIGDDPVELPTEAPPPSCAQIVEDVFSSELGGCASAACHRSAGNSVAGTDLGAAPHGLWLDSRANFATTAIGRVAHQTDVGDVSGGVAPERSARFGARMALIDPKNPGASYLMYKLLIKPENYQPCGPLGSGPFCTDADPGVSLHPLLPLGRRESLAPEPDELERLRSWFVQGRPMPLDPNGLGLSVGLAGMRAVSAFIAAGADCRP